MIDIEKIKERLETLKNPRKNKDFKKDFLKIEEGSTVQVRLVPPKDGDPFKSCFFHYSITPGGALCPKANFGEPCSVCDFVAKLFNDKTEESKEMAKDLMKKQRFFSQVIVRGKENEGIKLWSYPKTVYEDLLKAFVNPDVGDITDPKEGYDVEIESKKIEGKKYANTKIDVKRKSSPLFSKEQIAAGMSLEKLFETAPKVETIFKSVSSGEIDKMLEDFLNPKPDPDVNVPPADDQHVEANGEVVEKSEKDVEVVSSVSKASKPKSKIDEALESMRK